MDSASALDEVVLFELPITDYAQRLWLRLQETRLAWLHRQEETDTLFVAAALRPEAGDLAVLLREVENWVTECGLSYVPFELDARRYELHARDQVLAGKAA
jgi:hypothetical protein